MPVEMGWGDLDRSRQVVWVSVKDVMVVSGVWEDDRRSCVQ